MVTLELRGQTLWLTQWYQNKTRKLGYKEVTRIHWDSDVHMLKTAATATVTRWAAHKSIRRAKQWANVRFWTDCSNDANSAFTTFQTDSSIVNEHQLALRICSHQPLHKMWTSVLHCVAVLWLKRDKKWPMQWVQQRWTVNMCAVGQCQSRVQSVRRFTISMAASAALRWRKSALTCKSKCSFSYETNHGRQFFCSSFISNVTWVVWKLKDDAVVEYQVLSTSATVELIVFDSLGQMSMSERFHFLSLNSDNKPRLLHYRALHGHISSLVSTTRHSVLWLFSLTRTLWSSNVTWVTDSADSASRTWWIQLLHRIAQRQAGANGCAQLFKQNDLVVENNDSVKSTFQYCSLIHISNTSCFVCRLRTWTKCAHQYTCKWL